VTTIYRRFDSWQGAVARAGFEPRDPNTRTSNADLIDALQELADELGESPTTRQMNEHGRYWSKAYRDRFGSWVTHSTPPGSIRSTTTRIVVSPTPTYSTSSNDSADAVGGRPTTTQMNEKGAYSPETYWRHFGSWRAAVEAIGFDADDLGGRP